MNVSDRQKAYIQINEDAESVFSVIEEFAGVLPFDDHASPEVIKREFGLSKNAFKRAVGHLMKEGKVEIRDKRIYIKNNKVLTGSGSDTLRHVQRKVQSGEDPEPCFYDKENKFGVYTFTCPYRIQSAGWFQ